MNVLHVGLGSRGKDWLAALRGRSDVTSVGGVDPDAAARRWTETHVPELASACHADLDEALRRTRADAAIIASPVAQRAGHAIAALQAGLAVLIEMPFASSLEEAARVVAVGRHAGRTVMGARRHRYAPCVRRLRRLVREGKVGAITHVSCIDRRSPAPGDAGDLAPAEYPQLGDVAARHFDGLRAVLAVNPVSVMARCLSAPGSDGHGSRTEALLEMEGNLHVLYHGSLRAGRHEHALWIEGDTGVLWTDGARIWWRKRGWPVFLPIGWGRRPTGDALRLPREVAAELLQELQAAVIEGRIPESSGDDCLWTLAMIEAVMRSDRTEQVVGIATVLSGDPDVRPAPDLGGREAGAR